MGYLSGLKHSIDNRIRKVSNFEINNYRNQLSSQQSLQASSTFFGTVQSISTDGQTLTVLNNSSNVSISCSLATNRIIGIGDTVQVNNNAVY